MRMNKEQVPARHNCAHFHYHKKHFDAIVRTTHAGVHARRKQGQEEECTFSKADLFDYRCLGGYPIRCPVLGVELNWAEGEQDSMYSPRVGRYDPAQPFKSGNVVIMSKLAKKLLEGTRGPAYKEILRKVLRDDPYAATAFTAWADKHLVPSTPAVEILLSAPREEIVPKLPSLKEQEEYEYRPRW